MTKPLASRIALVTGGSRGIGHALAIALAREGAHVVATARTPGGLEELDDAIKAVGGTATLVPLEMRDYDGIARLAGALNERYGKLDILVGNAALGGSNSPLDHFEAKEWDEVMAVNVTANWHLIRTMHALLLRSDAGRVVFLTSGAAANPRAYRGLYAVTKARARDDGAHLRQRDACRRRSRSTCSRPGPTRTRMRAAVAPGEDPMTLPTAEAVAETIVPMCLPSFAADRKDLRLPRRQGSIRSGRRRSFR